MTTKTVKGKYWSDLRDWSEVEAVEVRLCEGLGDKWALAFDEKGHKYLADYEEIKAIVEKADVVEEINDLIDVKTVVFDNQEKSEDCVLVFEYKNEETYEENIFIKAPSFLEIQIKAEYACYNALVRSPDAIAAAIYRKSDNKKLARIIDWSKC